MLFQLATRNLLRNKRRTVAILLTVGVGSASIFLFHGFNAGIMNQYRDNTVHCRYGHGQVNQKGYREQAFEKPWEHWMTGVPELSARLLKVPGVKQVFPRVEFFALLTNGHVNIAGRGQGVDGVEEAKFFNTLNVEEGTLLTDQPDGILLGRGLAKALAVHKGDRVTVLGNTINGSLNGADLTVVGIFHTGAKDFDDTVFRIPLKQAQLLLDTDRVEAIALGLNDVADWPALADVVAREYPQLEATPFAVLDKIYYQNSVDWLGQQFAVIELIILIIVILGIFNTVSSGVLERKQEIGNLRANGESPREALTLLTAEGLTLGVVGAALGIAFALALNLTILRNGILMPPAPGLTRQFYVRIELQPMMALWAFCLGSFTAVVGGMLAGLKVVRMSIGDLLRSI
jgi:putative ABC transport system permease protein